MTQSQVDWPSEKTGDAISRIAALSPRCREVLGGIVAGCSNKVIAYDLGISPRTVEVHRARMMHTLGARHVADVIRLALEAKFAGQRARTLATRVDLALDVGCPQGVSGPAASVQLPAPRPVHWRQLGYRNAR